MKIFKFAGIIALAAAATDVEEFCGVDLHAMYGTDANIMKYVSQNKKKHNTEKNPDKPRRPGSWRVVVRPECLVTARRNTKPGGYPVNKSAPIIKCTKKGPKNTEKTKPNGRRYKESKLLEYQVELCKEDEG